MPLPTQPVTNELNPERLRAILFGAPGAGKTTLAAGWYPATNLIIDLEGGTRFLPGSHFIERPATFSEFVALCNELAAGGHQFKTVTVDTVDKLVRLADAEAGQRGGKVAAGLVEYGKGMADRDAVVMRELAKLIGSDLGLILCAHPTLADVKVGEKPSGEAINEQRWFPRIDQQDRLRQPIMGEVDFVLRVKKNKDETRELVTGGAPDTETKRRVVLPDVLPADAGALYAAVEAGCKQVQAQPQAVAA